MKKDKICCNQKMKIVPYPTDKFPYYKCDVCGYYKPTCFGLGHAESNCIQCSEEEKCCEEILKNNR